MTLMFALILDPVYEQYDMTIPDEMLTQRNCELLSSITDNYLCVFYVKTLRNLRPPITEGPLPRGGKGIFVTP